DKAKNALLGSSAALLMPIEWNEPFGMVMPEAMACGTPVIAFGRGSVPEVIREGINGYICRDVVSAAAAVNQVDRLDRTRVRKDSELRFSSDVVVSEYESLYEKALFACQHPN